MRAPLAIVYGGGGPFATACGMGVGRALRESGVPLDTTPTMGTSGGAWAAAGVLAGFSHDRVVEVTRHVSLPDVRPGRLHSAALELFADRREPSLWTSVVRVQDGRRLLLWGGDHATADIVAASSSVPWMVIPHRLDGRYYVDGGARSWISADLAPNADRLLVIAPGIAPALGRFGVVLRRHLGLELRRWKQRSGGRVKVIHAEASLAARVTRWKHLFDPSLAQEAYDGALAGTLSELGSGGRLAEFLAAGR
jgi:NTE family protein